MGILARAGEEIKDRDGKLVATIASDIGSGDVNVRANQFTFPEGQQMVGAYLPEEIYQFIRDRLALPPIEDEPAEVKTEGEAIGQTETIAGAKGKGKK